MSRHPALSVLFLGSLATVSALVLSPSAHAFQKVQVGGQNYEVTTFEGSYDDQPGFFAPPPPQGQGRMAWWGNRDLAEEIAFAIGDSLKNTINPDQGVFFAFNADETFVTSAVLALNPPSSVSDMPIGKSERMIYAILAPNQSLATVPGPLPILGATACFAWSRRLRKRIGADRG
jgi:hypothetical protein